MTEFLVLGLDGAGFQLLGDWLDDGTLPTLSKYIEQGASGRLRSAYPPVTSPNWRCYSTGVNPGKHGVFWWEQIDRDAGTVSIPDATDFDAPDLWDYLGDKGYTCGVVNMPTTFPPEPLNGYMVSGGGVFDGNDYTYPPGIKAEIEERFDYQAFLDVTTSNIGVYPEKVDDILDLIETRFQVADYIRSEYDPGFLHLTIFYTNVFNHHYWDADVTKQVWKRVDELIDEFVEDETVFLMSDHGSNEIHQVFNVNKWLETEGYLVTTETVSDRLHNLGLTRGRLSKLADKSGLKTTLKSVLPRSVIDSVPTADGEVDRTGKAAKIDWGASVALASGQGPVYVLETGKEGEHVREEISEKLASLKTPLNTPVARTVHRGTDVYSGPYVNGGPDLVIDQADHIHISGAIGGGEVFRQPDNWLGENHRDGLFVAAGPDISPGVDLGLVSIYDIAPTVLHRFGAAIPKTMDGRVLTELFDDASDAATREVHHREWTPEADLSHERGDQEQMRDRLQDLGYLSE